ncbi:hypothetical protein [Brevibacterium album]|uniref:hypothetical protein n=1 Tax=Brevibacterium album TaxID=417948 RepID=UPI000415CEC3|nr:hypothetical protein [Brevibacterium album]
MQDITQKDVVKALRNAPWIMVTTARRDGKVRSLAELVKSRITGSTPAGGSQTIRL